MNSEIVDAGSGVPSTNIAIIGIAGRWPGASTSARLWQNVCEGVDSTSRFSADELEVAVRSGTREATELRGGAVHP